MEPDLWIYVLEGVVFIALPVLLFVEMYIGHMDYTGLLEKCGFGKREVGLLLVGGLVGIVLGPLGLFGVPLFIYQSSYLAIDLGGAIIPIVLSLYLIKIKKINIPAFLGAVCIIGILTYMTTEFRPSLGIVSEFPYYLFPSFTAIAITLVIYRRNITSGIPFAYSTTTFGVLIGADIVRIPQVMVGLEEIREEMGLPIAGGSIGGAGGLDLVFLAGLLAIAPLLFLAPRILRHSEAHTPPSKAFSKTLSKTILLAEEMFEAGDYEKTMENALRAVDMKIKDVGLKFHIDQSPYITLDMLYVHPYIRNDYWLLFNASKSVYKTREEAFRAILTAKYIIRELERVEMRMYATHSQRFVAFLIDMILISVAIIILFIIGGIIGLYDLTDILAPQNLVWLWAFALWLWVAQAVYFTIFEGWWGQTPGKRMIRIIVSTDEREKCGFMDAFTRNVVRLLDTVLFFYIISVIMMSIYPKKQRIGDMVAKTVVLKV
ncbi:MAG: RDD family protein [Methanomassiliicoccales archaeon]|nr:MAG: RDD family protein [Methanomassiliicoccales archaeon]